LTLEEVVRAVMETYPLVRVAELDRTMADADVRSAQGGFDTSWKTKFSTTPLGYYNYTNLDTLVEQPTRLWGTSFFAGYRRGIGKYPVYSGDKETLSFGEFRVGALLPLWRNGAIDRRRANVARAEAGVQVAQTQFTQQQIDLIRTVSQRYWDWAAAGQRLLIARGVLSLAVERDAGLATRVEKGDVPAIERTDNARAILQRQAQVVSAERSLQQAALELSMYLRGSDGKLVVPDSRRLPTLLPDPSLPVPASLPDAIRQAWARRPDLKRLDALRQQADIEVAVAVNQTSPSIDAQAMISRDLGDGNETLRPTHLEVGVLLDIPLQNRVASGRRDAAKIQRLKVQTQQQFARDRITTDVRDAFSAVETAYQRASVTKREVQLATQLEQAERSRFQYGDSTLLIVNLREQASADARLREIDALVDAQKSWATYRAVLGHGAAAGDLKRP